jgi:hypothetical protein
MNALAWVVFLALGSALAQSPASEIRATGAYTLTKIDTPELAREWALIDAREKALHEAVARVQNLAEVRPLRLAPAEVAAFVAAIVDIEQPAAKAPPAANATTVHADVLLRLDLPGMSRRLRGLHKDRTRGTSWSISGPARRRCVSSFQNRRSTSRDRRRTMPGRLYRSAA